MSGKERDDEFDFSEQILGIPAKESSSKEGSTNKLTNPYQLEVQTSYLLVNALLTLLIRKGIIFPHEVQVLVAELHTEYLRTKRGKNE